MLIKFESKGAASFEMLDTNAIPLLRLMGHGGKSEGAISGPSVLAALSNLEKGLAEQSKEQATEADISDAEDLDEDPPVSPSIRAVPLIEMLHHAVNNDTFVMWRPL